VAEFPLHLRGFVGRLSRLAQDAPVAFATTISEPTEARIIRHWQRGFDPVEVGPFRIQHAADPVLARDGLIRLEPGLAFGTGAHVTTVLCLEWLVARCTREPLPALLDVGTGTGVLSIAALMLGAPSAVGIDVDREVLPLARRNAELNGVGDRFSTRATLPRRIELPLILANVYTAALVPMAQRLADRLSRGGVLVLSGVREGEEGVIEESYLGRGLRVIEQQTRLGWSRISLVHAG
jgi:ribosomal protein L11 methyltransferase